MKEPDEWSSSFQRWLPAITGVILSMMVAVFVYTGTTSTWWLVFQLAVIFGAFAIQLEYEWKKGILS